MADGADSTSVWLGLLPRDFLGVTAVVDLAGNELPPDEREDVCWDTRARAWLSTRHARNNREKYLSEWEQLETEEQRTAWLSVLEPRAAELGAPSPRCLRAALHSRRQRACIRRSGAPIPVCRLTRTPCPPCRPMALHAPAAAPARADLRSPSQTTACGPRAHD
jgi:hypothetical protein